MFACVALGCGEPRDDAARESVAAVTPAKGQDAATPGAAPDPAPAKPKPRLPPSQQDAGAPAPSSPAPSPPPAVPKGGKPTPIEDAGAACDLPCEPPQYCEWVAVTCVRAPCPPQPMCVGERTAVEDCDPRHRSCDAKAPECPFGQVPSLKDGCHGPCIRVERCACDEAEQCPNPETYTCHRSAHHCGPYVE